MRTILARTTIALGLGIAAGAAFAQEQQPAQPDMGGGAQTECQPGDPGCPSAEGAKPGAGGQAGETTTPPTEGQAGDTTQPKTEGQAGDTTQPKTEGQAGDTTQPKTEGQAGDTTQPKTEGQAGDTTQPKTEGQATDTTQPKTDTETTGAIGDTNITVEQKTEIRQVLTQVNVEPVRDIDIDIEVGVAVPRTIRLHPVPRRIVEIVPAYEDYLFFILADGRIVIVEPSSLKIVVILTA